MQSEDLEKLEPEELLRLSEANTSDFQHGRSQIYKAADLKFEKQGEKQRIVEMKYEVLIHDLMVKNRKGKRFLPLMAGSTDKGESWEYPDDRQFTPDALAYYQKRADETVNPILKARYADFLWEKRRDGVKYAKMAIRAYLDCTEIYLKNEWNFELQDAVERALRISISIYDNDLIKESLTKHVAYIESFVNKEEFRYILEIAASLLDNSDKSSEPLNLGNLRKALEAGHEHYGNIADRYGLQRSFLELIAETYRKAKDTENVEKTQVRIAESYIQEAEWKKENYPSGNFVAAKFYEDALKAYNNLGKYPDKVEEIKAKMQESFGEASKTDFTEVSVEVKVPNEAIEKHLEQYRNKSPEVVLKMLAADKFIPTWSKAKEQAEEQLKTYVFQALASMTTMRGSLNVKQIGDKDKIEHTAKRNFITAYRLTAGLILERIMDDLEKKADTTEAISIYLEKSEFVSDDRRQLIRLALESSKIGNDAAAIHILVFQIEGILRDMLKELGLPVITHHNGTTRAIDLTDILDRLIQFEGVDKDLLRFIDLLLNDEEGENYRNDIAHGLAESKRFDKQTTRLLILILLKLGGYKKVEK